MSNRVLETVTGYDKAVEAIATCALRWNESNGSNRMQQVNPLQAEDVDGGSGEFFKAVCLNINEAENLASEIYEIQTCW